MNTKIYALCDENNQIRYIGKTVQKLKYRLYYHLSEARTKKDNTHRLNWIRSMLKKGYIPTITLIGEVDGDGNKEEIAWIKYFRDEGVKLTNGTNGGDGMPGWHHSEASKLKNRLAHLGNRNAKGHKVSKESKEKIRLSNLGNQNCKGHKASKESKEKMRISHLGKRHTKETINKCKLTAQKYWDEQRKLKLPY